METMVCMISDSQLYQVICASMHALFYSTCKRWYRKLAPTSWNSRCIAERLVHLSSKHLPDSDSQLAASIVNTR